MKAGTMAAIAVLMTAVLLSVLPVRGEERIYEGVIRLHVMAVSDAAVDQHRKLAVRDRVLASLYPVLRDVQTVSEAEAVLGKVLAQVQETAEEALVEMGDTHGVTVHLVREKYPTRLYGNFAMPAGEYLSLQVILGAGEGHNWWCVLFPTVCGQFASDGAEVWRAAGFTPEEYRMITGEGPQYKIRFRILELLQELAAGLRREV